MKNTDDQLASSAPERRIFSEILVPGNLSNEDKFERIVKILREVGLNPFQVFHVLGAIDQFLQKLVDADISMLVNISIIGIEIKNPAVYRDENFQSGDSDDYAYGFFMVYKFINDRDKNPSAASHISLDILVYAE